MPMQMGGPPTGGLPMGGLPTGGLPYAGFTGAQPFPHFGAAAGPTGGYAPYPQQPYGAPPPFAGPELGGGLDGWYNALLLRNQVGPASLR
jgi:hypothetical protein